MMINEVTSWGRARSNGSRARQALRKRRKSRWGKAIGRTLREAQTLCAPDALSLRLRSGRLFRVLCKRVRRLDYTFYQRRPSKQNGLTQVRPFAYMAPRQSSTELSSGTRSDFNALPRLQNPPPAVKFSSPEPEVRFHFLSLGSCVELLF